MGQVPPRNDLSCESMLTRTPFSRGEAKQGQRPELRLGVSRQDWDPERTKSHTSRSLTKAVKLVLNTTTGGVSGIPKPWNWKKPALPARFLDLPQKENTPFWRKGCRMRGYAWRGFCFLPPAILSGFRSTKVSGDWTNLVTSRK